MGARGSQEKQPLKVSPMLRNRLPLLAVAALLVTAALVIFAPADKAGVLLLLAAAPVAAPSANRPTVQWGRKREPAKTFNNVGAGNTAYSKIARYPRTVLGILLDRSGSTTFTDAQGTRIELFLGEKSIWGPISMADLRQVDRYINGEEASGNDPAADPSWLELDFTNRNVKEIGGEQIGGLDLSTLPDGEVRLEVDIAAGAAAPQIRGHMVWGPPQGGGDLGGLMRKLIKRTYPAQPAGDFFPEVQVRGAILCRQYWKGIVISNAVATAFTAANAGTANTGNGVASATVTAGTPAGRYTAICIEPGANVGTFAVYDAKGKLDGIVTVGAGAKTMPSGLVVTIADGAADFISGDGFFFDVLPLNTDGNINLVEVKKNEDNWWVRTDRAARFEQFRYGRTPQAGLYVADYLLDNHSDSVIDTANASTLDYRLNLTLADTPSVIHEVLASPTFGASRD
jgi:hypothetical protein